MCVSVFTHGEAQQLLDSGADADDSVQALLINTWRREGRGEEKRGYLLKPVKHQSYYCTPAAHGMTEDKGRIHQQEYSNVNSSTPKPS